jgi:hypothetical protein
MLISGSSGAAKSRFVFGLCEEWYTKSTFLGRPAKPNPAIRYFAYDRSIDDIHDILNDMGFDFPQMQLDSKWGVTTAPPSPAELKGVDAFIIDGIDFMVDDMSNPQQVRSCLSTMGRLVRAMNNSCITITGSAKIKAGEAKYSNVRERGMGSAYWGRSSGSVVDISYDPMDPTLTRHVAVQPYCGGPAEFSEWNFNQQNRLERNDLNVIFSEEDERLSFLASLPKQPPTFSTARAEQIGESLSLSRATVHRYLAYLSETKNGSFIHKIGRGEWSRMQVQ